MNACEILSAHIGSLFTCREHGEYVRIRTPFLMPNGDVIDVFLSGTAERGALTDFGETLAWLRLEGSSLKRSPKQNTLITEACETNGVELTRGMLIARFTSSAEFPAALFNLCQAAIRVADISFTFRTRSSDSIVDAVDEFLSENRINHKRNVAFEGKSGSEYKVDFEITSTPARALLSVMTTGSQAMTRRLTEKTFTQWQDLHGSMPDAKLISVLDDSEDIWLPQQISLIEGVSAIAPWSKPETLLELLQAA